MNNTENNSNDATIAKLVEVCQKNKYCRREVFYALRNMGISTREAYRSMREGENPLNRPDGDTHNVLGLGGMNGVEWNLSHLIRGVRADDWVQVFYSLIGLDLGRQGALAFCERFGKLPERVLTWRERYERGMDTFV